MIICMAAIPEAIYSILALNKIGANANILNPTFTSNEMTTLIDEAAPKLLIVMNELYDCIKESISKTTVKTVISCAAANSLGICSRIFRKVSKIANTISWSEFVSDKHIKYKLKSPYKKNQQAIVVYSSGTTGASKGIQLTNDSINATITEYRNAGFNIRRQDRYFAQIPIWFSTGISVTILVPICLGVTVILEPKFDLKILAEHISKYKPNFMVTPSGLIEYLMSNYEINEAYKYFKYLVIGGDYIVENREKQVNQWLEKNGNKNKLQKGYGMCECGGTVTSTLPQCNKIGYAGIPLPHIIVASFDMNTNKELKYGQRGEIRVLSPCVSIGYLKKPEETAKYFYEDSKGCKWACTGDMGYVDKDGNVFVCGRISDSYIDENGETIYLFDIERTILEILGVRQCKVVVSEIDGRSRHVAHIVLNKDMRQKDFLNKVNNLCKEKLKPAYIPMLFKFYDASLPVAPSGKLDITQMKNDTKEIVHYGGN